MSQILQLMQDYEVMKQQAEALATVRGCRDRPGVPVAAVSADDRQWRVADVDSKSFGEIIPYGDLADVTKNVSLESDGVQKRLHVRGSEIFTLELVSNYDEWKERKRPGLPGGDAGDLRILGCTKLSLGKRQLGLTAAVFLESILENGGDIKYHSSFMRKSGLSDNSAAAHELKNLLAIVKLAVSIL